MTPRRSAFGFTIPSRRGLSSSCSSPSTTTFSSCSSSIAAISAILHFLLCNYLETHNLDQLFYSSPSGGAPHTTATPSLPPLSSKISRIYSQMSPLQQTDILDSTRQLHAEVLLLKRLHAKEALRTAQIETKRHNTMISINPSSSSSLSPFPHRDRLAMLAAQVQQLRNKIQDQEIKATTESQVNLQKKQQLASLERQLVQRQTIATTQHSVTLQRKLVTNIQTNQRVKVLVDLVCLCLTTFSISLLQICVFILLASLFYLMSYTIQDLLLLHTIKSN